MGNRWCITNSTYSFFFFGAPIKGEKYQIFTVIVVLQIKRVVEEGIALCLGPLLWRKTVYNGDREPGTKKPTVL